IGSQPGAAATLAAAFSVFRYGSIDRTRIRMSQLMSQSGPSAITSAMILASGAVLLLAAWHDVVSRTVPNWMSVAIACDRLPISLGLGLAIFVVAAICWRRGWMGGADVKLLGAIAIVLPPG